MSSKTDYWVKAKVGEIMNLVNGAAFKPSDWASEGLPIIRIQNLNNRDAGFNYFNGQIAEKYRVKTDDLLFAWSGTPGTSFGAHIWKGGDAWLNQHIFRVEFDRENLNPEFLRLAINQNLADYVRQAHGGAGLAHITKARFEESEVLLPPLNEQRRIVAKLDTLFEKSRSIREKLDRLPRLLANLQKSILNSAFRGDLTKEWRDKNQLSTACWQSVTVGEVANSIFDGPFGSHLKSKDYTDSGVRVIRLENIGNLRFHRDKETYITEEKYGTLSRHRLLPRDILFSSFVDEEVRVCIFPEDVGAEAINKADCFCIRPNEQICDADFLLLRLSSNQTYRDMKEVVHGATRPRINLSQLKNYSFILPSLAEQREIVRSVYTTLERIRSLAGLYSKLSAQNLAFETSSLKAAFRGELVPQDPNDEPASVLLERIRAQKPAAGTKRGRGRKAAA